MEDCRVIIKCFETPGGKYFYDRFLNSIVRVDEEEFKVLKVVETTKSTVQFKQLKKYKKVGLLEPSIINKIENSMIKNIEYLTENNISHLILQLTQQCNLRCNYCAYSGKYENRQHTNQKMSYEIAKKAIDFFMNRNRDSKELSISFYGGEPLLEFNLIKRCVSYYKSLSGDKIIHFAMTTNATLLCYDEIVDFLIENKFQLLISLDGSKDEHDANRKFVNGNGSFDIVLENIKKIRDRNNTYYNENISFNAVTAGKTNLQDVIEFFSDGDLFPFGHVTLNGVSPNGLKDESLIQYEEKYLHPYRYELLKLYLCMIKRVQNYPTNAIMQSEEGRMERLYWQLHEHVREFGEMHHDGPCIPGVRRLFVTVDGEFYPCERVSECSKKMNIGNLDDGYNFKNIEFLMNHGASIEENCLECWNLRQCRFCLAEVFSEGEISTQDIINYCPVSKGNSLSELIKISILSELNYFPEEGRYEKVSNVSI